MKMIKTCTCHLLVLAILMSVSSCKLGRFAFYQKSNITDHKIFLSRSISAPADKFEFYKAEESIKLDSVTITEYGKKNKKKETSMPFDDYIIDNETVALIVIRNDTILYEKYFNGYNEASVVNSFSMAKSYVSALIGIAIEEGYIKSIDQPIMDYIPELKENRFDAITIDHLLDMRSGIKFSENYLNPFGEVASFYYGTNLRKEISKLELEVAPGTVTNYRSVDTQLLGLLLKRALPSHNMTDYLEEKIWQPLGMEYDASWSLDRKKNGLEKSFCCLNARARDFAKFGRLYLQNGNWNGKQIVSKEWVVESTKLDTTKGEDAFYNNQWWIYKDGIFRAEGHLGQYISVHPKSNMIMVRLGKDYGKTSNWKSVFNGLEAKLGAAKNEPAKQ